MASKNIYLLFLCFLLLLGISANANSRSIIRYLPGLDGPLPFELETGYITVTSDIELFYYFIESENNPSKDPLLFWFTGGPGCSGFSTLAFTLGPLLFKNTKYNGSLPSLELNPYSWTTVANVVFLDSPVGTGFSYSRTSQGFSTSDTLASKQSYTFIRKWLIDHSNFLANPIYIGGDSYAGITVPIIVQEISDGIILGDKPLINLKGYVLGNPLTDEDLDPNYRVQFAYGMGILSYEIYKSAKTSCQEDYINVDPSNVQCRKDLQEISKLTDAVSTENILSPKCATRTSKLHKMSRYRSLTEVNPHNILLNRTVVRWGYRHKALINNKGLAEDPLPPFFPRFICHIDGFNLCNYWANDERVRKALNVRNGTVQEWFRCRELKYSTDVKSSISYHINLSKRQYRSLIYSGDHDMFIPSIATQAWIKSLNYSIGDDWRPWFVSDEVAGYTRSYTNNMTFATIKGAGHIAQEFKPKECFAMFNQWLSYEPL